MNRNDNPKCFSGHMGPWLIEPNWMGRAVAAIKAGLFPEKENAPTLSEGINAGAEYHAGEFSKNPANVFFNGVGIIDIRGAMMKGTSKFEGNASTVLIRKQLRDAAADSKVKSIILAIDSPGGQVAGTKELADDIKAAAEKKTVIAQIEDLGASAALWAASQATFVYANATAEVGSIGVVAVLHDMSEAFDREGVKVHVVSTGEAKGAGTPGTPITDEILESVQGKVDALNEFFIKAIADGRKLTEAAVKEIATGETFMANHALELGLIDGVQTMDETINQATKLTSAARNGQRIVPNAKHELLKAQSRLQSVKNNNF